MRATNINEYQLGGPWLESNGNYQAIVHGVKVIESVKNGQTVFNVHPFCLQVEKPTKIKAIKEAQRVYLAWWAENQ